MLLDLVFEYVCVLTLLGVGSSFPASSQALDALSNECSARVKAIIQSLSANESHAQLKRQIEKDAKTLAAYFNVENASADIEQSVEIQLLTEKGLATLVGGLAT